MSDGAGARGVHPLRERLAGASRTSHVEEINGEFVAIDGALAPLDKGDG